MIESIRFNPVNVFPVNWTDGQEIVQMLHSIPYAQKIRLGKSKTFDILQFPNDMKYVHKHSKIR